MDTDGRVGRLWGVQEVAEYLRIPVGSVYKMTGRRARLRMPHVRLAGRVRFRKADVDRWIESLSVSNAETLVRVSKAAAQSVNNGRQSDGR
jgi:excisionase family DNA binding protein